jgi:hypothetical protein
MKTWENLGTDGTYSAILSAMAYLARVIHGQPGRVAVDAPSITQNTWETSRLSPSFSLRRRLNDLIVTENI